MLALALGIGANSAVFSVVNGVLLRPLPFTAARGREISIRAALGAGRARLVTQFLTESVVLSLSGGALGLLLAMWGMDALLAIIGDGLPRASEVQLDTRVVLFTGAVSVLTGLLFGLVPALQASRADLHGALREGTRGTGGKAAGRARGARVGDMLDRFQLVGKKDLYPNQLSGGQQQIVGIARALIASPKVLLADEPTGNLHSTHAQQIMEMFKALNREGTTVVQVTHSEANAAHGHRVVQMADGWIQAP